MQCLVGNVMGFLLYLKHTEENSGSSVGDRLQKGKSACRETSCEALVVVQEKGDT